jgi:type I restriction enzyme S subunit
MTNIEIDRKNWAHVKFGDVIENRTSRIDDPSKANVDRYVGLEHLDPGSMTITRWGLPTDVEATKLLFDAGDVVFGRRRAYQKKVARADFPGICSAHALVLRAKADGMLPDFLPVFLSSDYFLNRAIKISVGSLSPTVNWKSLAMQEFYLPPIQEQEQFAAIFWRIEDHLISLKELLLSTKDAFQAYLDEVFDELDAIPLEEIADVTRGISWGREQEVEANIGTPVLGIPNVQNGHLKLTDFTYIKDVSQKSLIAASTSPASILMVGSNGNKDRVGNVAICTDEVAGFLVASFLIHIKVKNSSDASFVFNMLMGDNIQKQITGVTSGSTGLKNLAITWVRKLSIPWADDPNREIISENCMRFEMAIKSIEEELRAITSLRSALYVEIWRDSV